jgi:hypothetical protein
MPCKNKLRERAGKGIISEICFDISDKIRDFRFQGEYDQFAKPYADRIKRNDYEIGYLSSFFLKPSGESIPKYLIVEVFFAPRDILAFLRFEKELKEEGYEVEFSREGKQKL